MKLPFFTIGHSNRSLEEFIELLNVAHINLVADIRTVPRSRTNPQFNAEAGRCQAEDEAATPYLSSV